MRARTPVRNAAGLKIIMTDIDVQVDRSIEAEITERKREEKTACTPQPESAETRGEYQLMRSYLIGSPDPEIYRSCAEGSAKGSYVSMSRSGSLQPA
jgi:hypothetical protein